MKKFLPLTLGLFFLGCGPDVDILQAVLLAPSKVDLIFPENNSECTAGVIISESESEVIFDWSDAEIGDGYRIALTNLTTGQESFFESDSSSLPIVLLRGTPYRWHVSSFLNDAEEPTLSDVEVFYNAGPGIQSFIPFPAINVAPVNGEQLASSSVSVTLQWTAEDLDGDISEYDVFFGSSNPPDLFSSNLSTNSLSNIPVVSGNTYFWKITTRDIQGNESNSIVFSFEVL